MFRYRVGVPVVYLRELLACSKEDWSKLTSPFGLAYTDTTREVLDCKASMAALPLAAKECPSPWSLTARGWLVSGV